MVAKGDSLAEILDTLCRLVEAQADDALASILLVDGDRLRHGGAPSLPKAYTDAINGTVIGPSAGSCGTAAYRGEPVIVEDIATDPLWADDRDLALPHSLRACWSAPVFSSQGKVIATFAMYYRAPRRPTQRDQAIIDQITHLAGVIIQQKLAEEKLQRSEAYLAEAQKLTHTGSWVRNDRQMFGSHQQPFLPRAILTDAVGSREHHAASQREPGVAGVLNDTRALIAEHQRRLSSRMSTRQDRVFERRDAGGRDADQHPVLCRLRPGQFSLAHPPISRKGLRLDRPHRQSPLK